MYNIFTYYSLILFCTLFILGNTKDETEDCNGVLFIKSNGNCINDQIICNKKYDTYPKDNEIKCNYERKRQIKALLLELLVTYGAGHFYMENYKYAIPKLVVFVFLYCLFIVLRIFSKAKEENKKTNLAISLSAIICFIGMIAWQVIDVVKFARADYKDGNDVTMYSMK